MSGLLANRYEILERLGEGSLLKVVKARDIESGTIVCVKTPFSAIGKDPSFCTALEHVIDTTKVLTGPSIAAALKVVDSEDGPLMVTEFVRGINLKERIRRIAPFTLSVSVDFAIAIVEALATGHNMGLVHGDVRPNNIIVTPEGVLKVTDFGLWEAIRTNQDAMAASFGRAVEYQSPQVSSGSPPSVSTDLYSLGVVLFEMLTGSLPFHGETPLIVAMNHQNKSTPSPKELNPGVPLSLEGITLKLLDKNSDRRYRTAESVLIDLRMVRDALRFGRSLSWSPLDNSQPLTADIPTSAISDTDDPGEPSAQGAMNEPRQAKLEHKLSMQNRDDKVPATLKIAIATVLMVIIGIGVVGASFWMSIFAKPDEKLFPKLIGMKQVEAETAANKVGVRLMVHEEYNDKAELGTVYKLDPDLTGREVRAGRSINVWVSKGSRWVDVPDVTGVSKDEAETKLKSGGLTLGEVERANDPKVPFDYVISQSTKPRARVARDTAVNLVLSDGPSPNDPTDGITPPADSKKPGNKTDDNKSGDPQTSPVNPEDNGATAAKTRTFNISTKVDKDGLGQRMVRFEYEDAEGTHVAVNEMHDEGETITAKVTVTGKKITARTYYGNSKNPAHEVTKELP